MTEASVRSRRPFFAGLVLFTLGLAALLPLSPLRTHLPAYLTALTLATIGYALAVWGVPTVHAGRWILSVGLGLRALMLPLPTSLSDDLYRYTWDGQLTVSGENPYRSRPIDRPDLQSAQPALYAALNSKAYYTIYPPLSQGVFAAAVWLGGSDTERSHLWMRAIFGAMDFVALGLIVAALGRAGMDVRRAALYGWHPLVLTELAGGGHGEAGLVLGVALLLMAVTLRSDRRRIGLGALGVAVATLTKLVPILALPLVMKAAWRRFGWWGAVSTAALAGAIMGAASAPFWAPDVLPHVLQSVRLYVQSFEFSAGPYLLLKHLGYAIYDRDLSKLIGPRLAAFTGPLVLLIGWRYRPEGGIRALALALLALFGGYLLLATTVHPWYALWPLVLVPFVPLRWALPPLWLAYWVSWTYLTYATTAYAQPGWVTTVEWSGVAVLLWLALFRRDPRVV